MVAFASFVNEVYLPYARRRLKPRSITETERLLGKFILPALGAREIDKLTKLDAEQLHEKLHKTPTQANRTLAAFSGVLSLAIRRGLINANPCASVERNPERKRERFLTQAEVDSLREVLAQATAPAARVIELLMLTGARPNELITAQWDWIQGSIIRLPDAKRGPRSVYLPHAALDILAKLPRYTGTKLIFWPKPGVRRQWERSARAAGITGVRLYDLRHTFASAALGAGVSLPQIGLLLGHRNAQTTLRYAHMSPEVGLEAAGKAAARLIGG